MPSDISLSSDSVENEIPPNIDQVELPMNIALKGDEDFFDQFVWDADQVMIKLSLKRTRLTQISGRELRVGRKKEGRYIKPYYRPEDVDQYLKWTRTTATHKKASDTVSKAAMLLKDTCNQLSVDQPLQRQEEQLQTREQIYRLSKEVKNQIQSLQKTIVSSWEFFSDRSDNQMKLSKKYLESLDASENRIEVLSKWLHNLEVNSKIQEKKIDEIFQCMVEQGEYQRKIILNIQENREEAANALKQLQMDLVLAKASSIRPKSRKAFEIIHPLVVAKKPKVKIPNRPRTIKRSRRKNDFLE